MTTKSDWLPVTRQRPCPICERFDNCTVARDGSAVWCGRVSEGAIHTNHGGQFLHVLRDREDSLTWLARTYRLAASEQPKRPTKDWGRIAQEAFDQAKAEAARQALSTELGVSVEALRRLHVGWMPSQRCWSFPERGAIGSNVIGIIRRFEDGRKRRAAGSQSGLTFDRVGWSESSVEPPHIFLVEGPSDTAALMSLGLAVVGRPSNLGGVDLLAELLRAVPSDRTIVVIGEHDRKAHESLSPVVKKRHKPECDGCSACWPGMYGAVTTATKLAERLGRPIAWAFPPDNAKDARAWLNSRPNDKRIE